MALAAPDQKRLLQLLGMSASDFNGEALAAVRLAHQLARRHGLNLVEAIEAINAAKAQAAEAALDTARLQQLQAAAFERGRLAGIDEARDAATPTWRVMRDHALATCPNLRPNEREFLVSLAYRYRLTPRQLQWLTDIYNRCPARGP